ncbi:uncharacterized protein LOC119743185 [Patiria miniata]|uniref:Uncharacterized protein n=1 Tax=Patiria miniata TaxID=46514 RepID=A0A914BHW8_PATMI|nr:uncharacterized protein LOC119743185 [Patiria miniata]
MTVTSPAVQPLVGGNQLTEFDMSRRMYDQVPPSLLQSSLTAGVVNSSGAMKSPMDIQKRILLQHLRLQLELLQAQRLQQACLRLNVRRGRNTERGGQGMDLEER